MDREEKIKLIERVVAAHEKAFAEYEKLTALVAQSGGGGSLWEAFCEMDNAMVASADVVIGDTDFVGESWLTWHICENAGGEKAKRALVGGKVFTVRGAADLLDVIEAWNLEGDGA